MIFLKNLLFFTIIIIYTIGFFLFFGIILIFIRLLSSKKTAQRALRFIALHYGKIIIFGFARILVKIKFIDSSKGKHSDVPCIYVVNHRSSSDAFLMGVLNCEFIQIVNLWPFKIPILGLCARLAGYLSIRSMSFTNFSKECKILFSDNISIIGFPEGTRSLSSQMGQFHSSLFRVAKENKLKIVPLCILGNKDKPLRGSLKINPGNIIIYQLPAIDYNEYANLSSFELKNYTRDKMQSFIDQHKEAV